MDIGQCGHGGFQTRRRFAAAGFQTCYRSPARANCRAGRSGFCQRRGRTRHARRGPVREAGQRTVSGGAYASCKPCRKGGANCGSRNGIGDNLRSCSEQSPYIEGPIPGDTGLRYSLDNDEGVLRFLDAHNGAEVAAARRGRDGIFFETETGIPVARMVGGSVVFDPAALANEAEDSRAQSGAKTSADTNTNTPQLCPDPGPDVPHGASPRSIAYQAHVSAINNPQRPLPPGLAVSLIDTKTGKRVVFDDCRESDGTMIEAKGPGFARLLRYVFFSKEILPARWERQADRQVSAAGTRRIEWFFAEPEAAKRAEEIFRDGSDRFKNIKVRYEPALVY